MVKALTRITSEYSVYRKHGSRYTKSTLDSPSVSQPSSTPPSCWCPPPRACLKLNSDAAVRPGLPVIGIGAAIRDHSGTIVAAMSKPLTGCFSPEISELIALWEGLILARQMSLQVQYIEVDVSNIAAGFNSASSQGGEFGLLLDDIKALCREQVSVSVKEPSFCNCQAISRKENRLPHNLASFFGLVLNGVSRMSLKLYLLIGS